MPEHQPEHQPLSEREAEQLDAHWRAMNYLSACQLYLRANPLLSEPLRPEHIKPRLLGHWGTCPGLGMVYTHLNRLISRYGQRAMAVWGPGHGAPAVLAGAWLEGSYAELTPDAPRDAQGMLRLFRDFSQPCGIPSHTAPDVPGSIQEGGELGYSLAHAYGAAFDNPELLVCAVVGDGEAETGPLATSWHANKWLDPVHDGAVLPVLHLNGYKIANPTVLARLPEDELASLLRGYGYDPLFVTAGPDTPPPEAHRAMARAFDHSLVRIGAIQDEARSGGAGTQDAWESRPRWPMVVLRTPKGWSGPREVDGQPVEGTWRAHQVPLAGVKDDPERLRQLERWLRSYRPQELFDEAGRPLPAVLECVPEGELRLGSVPEANGGRLLRQLPLPRLEPYAVPVERPGAGSHEPTRVLGRMLAELMSATEERRDFRLFGPDETDSNHLDGVYDATERGWQAGLKPTDEHLSRHGRVLEVLSEHLCQGWLEGYVLTGRNGLFASYEAFANLVASMAAQHVKWVHSAREVPWRRPIAGLNYLLTSHAWRQDHNGFSHQDPGFIDHVLSKSPDVVRVYLPPDTNTLLCVADHVLRTRDTVNVVVAGKQSCFDWLDLDQARAHCARGLGVWEWAGTERVGSDPDVVLACAGDVPTQETLAAASLLREWLPGLAVRVVNVVDIARLTHPAEHPHGLSDTEFDAVFTRDRPVIFAYHGYPWLVHRLAYRRAVHDQLAVRGYREMGSTTTPFDMVVRNGMDRYSLVQDVVDRTPGLGSRAAGTRQAAADMRERHHRYIHEHGTDMPEVTGWRWTGR
ncbi:MULTISPECIES: phosphoketolase family protein [unclassified Streptomyces]|uniref:phosphoketolase family protein n=1 Tax=unclassified Streptomyces TaxID=2593676 RepID=UPI002DD7DDFB|nr:MULTISPECIES: phosphoketolase family protein [unclassified Streptomyces]WSB74491.1 phosphoketolase family protein [Streptomyces sp. NBC_01775]WSS17124.1 phosphoketolase family protein [Streptomyces sp. NBC_01186]WSS45871.1 phosphoketolase family protein [Streptomyces sp. NBC_01187]